ncbi:hypothetical protein Hanom_Chr05g00441131 [Helianthus anomalus]
MSSGGETDQDKLEATKRKLQESYQQAKKVLINDLLCYILVSYRVDNITCILNSEETTNDTRDMPDVKELRPNGCYN